MFFYVQYVQLVGPFKLSVLQVCCLRFTVQDPKSFILPTDTVAVGFENWWRIVTVYNLAVTLMCAGTNTVVQHSAYVHFHFI